MYIYSIPNQSRDESFSNISHKYQDKYSKISKINRSSTTIMTIITKPKQFCIFVLLKVVLITLSFSIVII